MLWLPNSSVGRHALHNDILKAMHLCGSVMEITIPLPVLNLTIIHVPGSQRVRGPTDARNPEGTPVIQFFFLQDISRQMRNEKKSVQQNGIKGSN